MDNRCQGPSVCRYMDLGSAVHDCATITERGHAPRGERDGSARCAEAPSTFREKNHAGPAPRSCTPSTWADNDRPPGTAAKWQAGRSARATPPQTPAPHPAPDVRTPQALAESRCGRSLADGTPRRTPPLDYRQDDVPGKRRMAGGRGSSSGAFGPPEISGGACREAQKLGAHLFERGLGSARTDNHHEV